MNNKLKVEVDCEFYECLATCKQQQQQHGANKYLETQKYLRSIYLK